MSTYEFKLPDIGEGVTEGEIVKWLVSPGDRVNEDQPMVEVMTDKATVTITSPKAGTITETRGDVGAVVPVHSVLVVYDLGGGAAAPANGAPIGSAEAASHGPQAAAVNAKKDEGPAATAVGDIKEDLPGMNFSAPSAPKAAAPMAQTSYFNDKPLATPATRKLARDLGVDLRTVAPSGKQGRVTKDDVQSSRLGGRGHSAELHLGAAPTSLASSGAAPVAAPSAARPAQAIARSSSSHGAEEDERIPLRGVRKRIFEGMTRSKHTAAHFTFVEECDVTGLKAVRERLKPQAEKAGAKLTFLPFIAKAVVAALKKHPTLNSAFDESTSEIVVRKGIHLGIASSTEAGLIVPVVRDADRKSILDVAREIQRLGEDSKTGKVRPEDLGGSTFTITSLGAQGGLFATPILNHPEVGILGVHQIKQKPVVREGQIVVGDVMLLSLSFDHRIIDGHIGAAFAYEIIGYLENPDRLFLES
jgi:pyruvate dehydrogenase E2 component (dihydrolipoamide acetyltransferase)